MLHDRCRGCDDLLHFDAANREHLEGYARNCRLMERLTRAKTNLALLRKHEKLAAAAGGFPGLEGAGARPARSVQAAQPGAGG